MATRRLKTCSDVRRYMASLILRLENDEVTCEKAGKLGFLSNILLRTIQDSDLEDRIQALENQINGQGGYRR